jgi:hypothetical protein
VSDDVHTPMTAGPEPLVVEPAAAADGDEHGFAAALPIDPAERPELVVGAAFAGGLVAALILKRLGR